MPPTKKPTYIVANPRGIPAKIGGERIPIFKQTTNGKLQAWFEGDIYTGSSPEVPLARGFLVEKED